MSQKLMTVAIEAIHLCKEFQIHKKRKGLMGGIKSLFNREYKRIPAVHEISFKIGQGELVGFIGPNGAGKTTTLKMLSGLLHPTSGEVRVAGFTPFQRKNKFLKIISLVMGQKNQLFWDLPAIETFELNRKIYAIPHTHYKKCSVHYILTPLRITTFL
jgi:ABC-2 type transport system ATP-binding protein